MSLRENTGNTNGGRTSTAGLGRSAAAFPSEHIHFGRTEYVHKMNVDALWKARIGFDATAFGFQMSRRELFERYAVNHGMGIAHRYASHTCFARKHMDRVIDHLV